MKNKFPDYYNPSDEEYRQLWQNADIVLDANVLLDFYRVSESTYNDMIKLFEEIKDRTWIPYQAAKEYHRNIKNVVVEQEGKYRGTLDFIRKFSSELAQTRNHPFLSDELSNETTEVFNKLSHFIENQQRNLLENLTANNSTKDKIADLFNEKVWEEFSDELIQKISSEGEKRYLKKIPPGFKDKEKSGLDQYGDLIIWKEIIKWAKEQKHPILFITNDEKDDWFFKCEGRTIGPHQELISEFKKETGGQKILIYKLHQFLEYSKTNLDVDINKESVEELKTAIRTVVGKTENIETSREEETSDKEKGENLFITLESIDAKSETVNVPEPNKNNPIIKNELDEKGGNDGNID
jgi:hypothetical protein